LKVTDIIQDEAACFGADLEVLDLRELQWSADRYWSLAEK
jgi:hypothetical protein